MTIEVVSAVGAGDSFLGGMVSALAAGQPLEQVFRVAVAAGSAAVLTPGTELCREEDVRRLIPEVAIEEIVAALDYAHLKRLPSGLQTGVFWSEDWKSDAFLITLTESETDYSPRPCTGTTRSVPRCSTGKLKAEPQSHPRPVSDTSTPLAKAATSCC